MMNLQDNINKSLDLFATVQNNMLEMYKMGMGTISWSQQQCDNALKRQFEYHQQLRDEASKYVEAYLQMAQRNQEHMQKMMKACSDIAFENIEYPGFKYFKDMNEKLQKLYEKVFGQEK